MKQMKWFAALAALWLTFGASAAEMIDLLVSATDFGLNPQTNTLVTLTPDAPLRRTYGTNLITLTARQVRTTSTGFALFKDTLWGIYSLDIPGTTPTSWRLWITTNYSGRVSAALFVTNSTAMPPNPTANYYTMGQVDALLLSAATATNAVTAGVSNQWRVDATNAALGTFPVGMVTNGQSNVALNGTTNNATAYWWDGSASYPSLSANGGSLVVRDTEGDLGDIRAETFHAAATNGVAGFVGDASGLTNGNASNILASGTVPLARLGASGTPGSATFLRGDNTWQVPPANYTAVAGTGIMITTAGSTNTISLYAAPSVTSFVNDKNTVEIGTTITSTVLTWVLGGGAITNQSLDNSIGTRPVADRTYTHSSSYTTDRTYTLTLLDGTSTVTATSPVYFSHKRYFGTSTNTTLTSAQIIALTNEFSATRVKSAFSVSPVGEYIYFAYPASWGAASFTVNGLVNTAWGLVPGGGTVSFLNASGNTTAFNLYRTDTVLTGTYLITVY